MDATGPIELGRGVVVSPGAPPPEAWADCPRVTVGSAELSDPGTVVATLHDAWLARRPLVVELGADPVALREPQWCDLPPYELSPGFEFSRERLQFLVWANNYDARDGIPMWWHGRRAARHGADRGVREGGPADIVCEDGTPLYVDGGPSCPPVVADGAAVVHRWSAEAGSLRPAGRAVPGTELASDQLAAVAHAVGPCRVIAPAGSGKTRVLTERLRHLVADRRVHRGAITALAFNRKAADELQERCADIVTRGGPHIRTLNSVALAVVNGAFSAEPTRVRVLEESDVRSLLERLFEIPHQANTDSAAPYLQALSAIRLGLVSPSRAESAFPDAVGIAEGFDRYRAALAEAGAVDFDEQIYRAIEILLTDPDVRAAAQATCRHLLVDEFQDLNPAHLLLVRLLCAPGFDCFGVGDDDQVIYGYAGATPDFLIEFPSYFPGAMPYALEVNYRCPPAVIDAARHLLSYNRRRLPKEIRPPVERPGVTTVPSVELPGEQSAGDASRASAKSTARVSVSMPAGTGSPGTPAGAASPGPPAATASALVVRRAPAEQMAGQALEVIRGWQADGVDLEDMAVLARVNSSLLPIQVACTEEGIACVAPLDARVLQRTGIRTTLAYLRIGLDPDHIVRSDLMETVRRPSRRIARNVVDMLGKAPTTSVAEIRRLARYLSGGDVPKLESFADGLDAVAAACGTSTAAALRAVRLDVGLGSALDVLDASRGEADRSTHADELMALEAVAALHPDPTSFEPWLRASLGRSQPDGPRVLLSTVHRIKGREWGHVVVFGASQGSFPHRLSDDDEEERRIFHVALTRAKTQVVVVADADAPSIFVGELDGSRPRSQKSSGAGAGAGAGTPGGAAWSRAKTWPAESEQTSTSVSEGGRASGAGPAGSARSRSRGGSPDRPRAGDSPGSEQDPATRAADEALREWRRTTAVGAKVPAYVVMNDRHLVGIVERRPADLAELARCAGMGPVRLERYGDDILSVLESLTADS